MEAAGGCVGSGESEGEGEGEALAWAIEAGAEGGSEAGGRGLGCEDPQAATARTTIATGTRCAITAIRMPRGRADLFTRVNGEFSLRLYGSLIVAPC